VKDEDEDEQKFDIILLSGDGSRYSVSRVSSNNKIKDKMVENDTTACVICLQYAKNHIVVPGGYLISCTRCTQWMEGHEYRCPICRVPYNYLLRIFA
jgi:hypothetical protein